MNNYRDPTCEGCGHRRLNGLAVRQWYRHALAGDRSDLNDVLHFNPDPEELGELHSAFLGGFATRVRSVIDAVKGGATPIK